jgi:hypothetical protein
MTRALHSNCQPTLVAGAQPSLAARTDLTPIRQVATQQVNIFVQFNRRFFEAEVIRAAAPAETPAATVAFSSRTGFFGFVADDGFLIVHVTHVFSPYEYRSLCVLRC